MRALLRQLIIWALGAAETPLADPTEIDKMAAELKAKQ